MNVYHGSCCIRRLSMQCHAHVNMGVGVQASCAGPPVQSQSGLLTCGTAAICCLARPRNIRRHLRRPRTAIWYAVPRHGMARWRARG
jgi:hypothetical protein